MATPKNELFEAIESIDDEDEIKAYIDGLDQLDKENLGYIAGYFTEKVEKWRKFLTGVKYLNTSK